MDLKPGRLALMLVLLFAATPLTAESKKLRPKGCYNFSKAIDHPLIPPVALTPGTINQDRGTRKRLELVWGNSRGILKAPIKKAYRWLLNHKLWKDMEKTKLVLRKEKKKNYREFHELDVEVELLGVVTIQWIEQWGYRILKGTPENPEEILILYQKTETKERRTSHLKHLCGSILLKKAGKHTDMSMYEEARATNYTSGHILEMHTDRFAQIAAYKG